MVKLGNMYREFFRLLMQEKSKLCKNKQHTRFLRTFLKLFIAIMLSLASGVSCSASTDPGSGAIKAYVDLDYSNKKDEIHEEKEEEKENEKLPQEVLVVIDPGHGGEEWGTYYGSMYEKNVNLDISLRMGSLLRKANIKVAFTREKDIFMGLKERADFANELDAALFISVHNNHMPGNPDYRGTETLYCPPQKPVYSKMDGAKLASIVQKELIKTLKTVDNGIIYRPNLAVIRRTKMPAVIAEIGYISNASDRARLGTAEFRQKAAQALANATLKALDAMEAYRDEATNKLMINRD